MKILHILNSNAYSGAENVVITMINNMGNGFESIYMSVDGPISSMLKKENIDCILVPKLTISSIRDAINKHKPDIIHSHDFRAGVLSVLTGTSVPIINHLHANAPWMKKITIYTIVYTIICFRFKKFFTVSNSIFDEFIFGRMFYKNNMVVGNPISLSLIRNKLIKSELKDKSDLIFMGRLCPEKRPLFFLNIVKCLYENDKDIKVEIVGDGILRDDVEKFVVDNRLQKNVNIRGFLNNPYGLLANSKILCMPSLWEGFGLAAIEALSFGVPVVCSNVGGLPSIVDESCGMLCNDKIDEYTSEISMLLSDEAYWKHKKNNAIKKAEKMVNINEYINNMRAVYLELKSK